MKLYNVFTLLFLLVLTNFSCRKETLINTTSIDNLSINDSKKGYLKLNLLVEESSFKESYIDSTRSFENLYKLIGQNGLLGNFIIEGNFIININSCPSLGTTKNFAVLRDSNGDELYLSTVDACFDFNKNYGHNYDYLSLESSYLILGGTGVFEGSEGEGVIKSNALCKINNFGLPESTNEKVVFEIEGHLSFK